MRFSLIHNVFYALYYFTFTVPNYVGQVKADSINTF